MGPPDDVTRPDDPGPTWVAPEATTPTAAPPAPTLEAPAAAPMAATPVRLPAPLRPMTMGDLLDGGFNVLRTRPRTVFTVAAVFVVPVQLFVAFFNRNALEDFEQLVDQNFSTTTNPSGSVGSPLASIIGAIGQSYAHVLVAAAIALMIVDWYGGDDPGPRELLRRLRPHVGTLFVAWLFIHLLELAGAFLLGIGTIVVMALYAVAAPAIAIEGLGPFKGMARASRLDGGRFWFMVGFVILSGLVASAVGQVLALIPQFVGLALGPDYGWVAYGVGSIVSTMLASIVVGASTCLAYLDLRIRMEGMDLAWAADRDLPA